MSLFLILTKEMLLHTANIEGGIIKYPLHLDYPNLSIVLISYTDVFLTEEDP